MLDQGYRKCRIQASPAGSKIHTVPVFCKGDRHTDWKRQNFPHPVGFEEQVWVFEHQGKRTNPLEVPEGYGPSDWRIDRFSLDKDSDRKVL